MLYVLFILLHTLEKFVTLLALLRVKSILNVMAFNFKTTLSSNFHL